MSICIPFFFCHMLCYNFNKCLQAQIDRLEKSLDYLSYVMTILMCLTLYFHKIIFVMTCIIVIYKCFKFTNKYFQKKKLLIGNLKRLSDFGVNKPSLLEARGVLTV
jgi:hypothetical protein